MSVYHEMARLDEAAAMHEQAYRDEYERWAAEQQALAEAEAHGMAQYEADQAAGGDV